MKIHRLDQDSNAAVEVKVKAGVKADMSEIFEERNLHCSHTPLPSRGTILHRKCSCKAGASAVATGVWGVCVCVGWGGGVSTTCPTTSFSDYSFVGHLSCPIILW